MVGVVRLELTRALTLAGFSYYSILLQPRKPRCSLDYVFTISFLTQVVGVQSLHNLFMLLSNIKFLARRSVSAFAVQPTSTLRVSPQALSAAVAAVSQCWKKTHKSPGCLPIPPHEHIHKTFGFGLVAFANSAIPLYLAGEPRFELGSQ